MRKLDRRPPGRKGRRRRDLFVPQLLSLSLCPVLSGVRNLPLWGSPMIHAGCWSLTSSVSGLFSLDSKLSLLCPTCWCLARISFLSAGTTGLPPGICSSAKAREYRTTQLVSGWLRLHCVRNIDEHLVFPQSQNLLTALFTEYVSAIGSNRQLVSVALAEEHRGS